MDRVPKIRFSGTYNRVLEGQLNKGFSSFVVKSLAYLMIFRSSIATTLTSSNVQKIWQKKRKKALFNLNPFLLHAFLKNPDFWVPDPSLFNNTVLLLGWAKKKYRLRLPNIHIAIDSEAEFSALLPHIGCLYKPGTLGNAGKCWEMPGNFSN